MAYACHTGSKYVPCNYRTRTHHTVSIANYKARVVNGDNCYSYKPTPNETDTSTTAAPAAPTNKKDAMSHLSSPDSLQVCTEPALGRWLADDAVSPGGAHEVFSYSSTIHFSV